MFSLPLLVFSSIAWGTDGIHKNADIAPIPQMETGRAKYLSIQSLPKELKEVAAQDLKQLNGQAGAEGSSNAVAISDTEMAYRKNYYGRLRNVTDLTGKMKSPLANVAKSELANYLLEGAIPDGPTIAGPWSSVLRVYRRPDGALITLHEWDYVADRGGVLVIKELMNTKVNGIPAQISTIRAPSGEVISEIRWVTKKKTFNLSVFDAVDNSSSKPYDRDWLLKLAAAIE